MFTFLHLSTLSFGASLFENAFGVPEQATPLKFNSKSECYPTVERFDPNDVNLGGSARDALLNGVLFANDKSKGRSWLIQLGEKKTLRFDLPFPGGNHESAVSPNGMHFAIPHYETPTYNSTEGGGDPGSSVSIIETETGRSAVLPMKPDPWVNNANGVPRDPSIKPKPHGATFMPNGDLLVTNQVDNSIIRVDHKTGNVTAYALAPAGCSTPHLVRVIPGLKDGDKVRFAVTGCRGTNAGTPADYIGRLTIIELATGRARALKTPGGKWNEGITVTRGGEVWVGSLNSHFITVFGWGDSITKDSQRTLENIKTITTIQRRYPLRFAYDEVTDRVAVASINLAAVLSGDTSDSGLHVYEAKGHTLLKSMVLRTDRGVINSEGLRNGPGFFFTGGFDTQAAVVVDALSLEQVAEIHYPRCSLPEGFCETIRPHMPNGMVQAGMTVGDFAKQNGYSGWNNWSGGLCQATQRNPYDRRFTVLDGFNYSPVFPMWAKGGPLGSASL